jgi:hypothetical protein
MLHVGAMIVERFVKMSTSPRDTSRSMFLWGDSHVRTVPFNSMVCALGSHQVHLQGERPLKDTHRHASMLAHKRCICMGARTLSCGAMCLGATTRRNGGEEKNRSGLDHRGGYR